MIRAIDLVGQVFGRLTVLERVGSDKSGHVTFRCRCDCGNERIVVGKDLRTGHRKSCGCLSSIKHGHTKGDKPTITYQAWVNMRRRCSDKNNPSYCNYGRRGVKVCKRWQNSFENFLADMGEGPEGLTLDRINNDGNYTKNNCQWATWKIQANNRRPKNPQLSLFFI